MLLRRLCGTIRAMRYSVIVVVTCLSLIAARPTDAGTIRFNFTGTVESVSSTESLFLVVFNTTQTMSGFYTFESTTPDEEASSESGLYALTGYSITVGSYTAAGSSGQISTADNSFLDGLSVTASPLYGTQIGVLTGRSSSQLELLDFDTSAFSSDAAPLTSPALSAFESNTWESTFYGDFFTDVGRLRGSITGLTLQAAPAVPVPTASVPDAGATISLFGFAAAAVAAARRNLLPQ